ncbi:MAG: AIR synthase related protein [bacterium]
MTNQQPTLDHVNYDALDTAKNAFIAASRKTLRFAEKYGFIPDERLGASANVFALDLKPFLKIGADKLFVTLLPEGLGTADEAKPEDLTSEELHRFWHNIGIKTVGVMTNDAAAAGMQPVLLSLYLPCSNPEDVFSPEFMDGFLNGFVAGCKTVGSVYFSGETPQLKSKFLEDKIDIAGALFGIIPAGSSAIDGSKLAAGNSIVFIEASGPHANGYTSLRKLSEKLPNGYRTQLPSGQEYWEAINDPTPLYAPLVQDILQAGISPTNVEPITGHGWQKLMRSSKPLRYVIEQTLPVTEVFTFVQEHSNTSVKDMVSIFNYGVGLAIMTENEAEADRVVAIAKARNLNAIVAGKIEAAGRREVVAKTLGVTLTDEAFLLKK